MYLLQICNFTDVITLHNFCKFLYYFNYEGIMKGTGLILNKGRLS